MLSAITLLIQSLQQGIFCVFNFLAAVLLVSHSQPLIPVDCSPQEKRGWLCETNQTSRPLRTLSFSKLKVITLCRTEEQAEEWSGHDSLQSVLHSFLLFWVHYFSVFSIGCNNGKMMTMTKTMIQLQLGSKPCILLQSSCTTTYQVTTRVKQSIWSHKQAACPSKNFEEIIFVVEVKSTKKAKKFIVLKNFPLYGTQQSNATSTFLTKELFLITNIIVWVTIYSWSHIDVIHVAMYKMSLLKAELC